MMSNDLSIIILAAGKGTRMKSDLPKTLHKISSFSMLDLVISKASALNSDNICVLISEEMSQFKTEIEKNYQNNTNLSQNTTLEFAIQKERLGTAHAVKIALENLSKIHKNIVILYGDTPLIKVETLKNMLQSLATNQLSILGFDCFEENKYGRLVTKNQDLEKIVEFKDANEEEKAIILCNSGVVALKDDNILDLINKIDNKNAAQEYYLTDIVQIMKNLGKNATYIKADEKEVLGVNSRIELSRAESLKQDELRAEFMKNGVTLIDPKTTYFAADTKIENDVIIHPNVVIGKNVEIKKGVEIKSFSHLEGVLVENDVVIGPFARLRPDTIIEKEAKIGNFVEIKKSKIQKGAKINHLSYVGNSDVGKNSNIGAGTITCNYDGYNKSKTVIGEGAFIGSNSCLVAPVNIGANSLIGAGSVITKDVLEDELAVTRPKQLNIKDGGKKHHEKNKK